MTTQTRAETRDVLCASRVPIRVSIYSSLGSPEALKKQEWTMTYEWQAAVCAPADLWLVYVDEDPWVAQGPATTVTFDSAVVCPTNGLLVDELNGSVWAWL